MLTRVCGAVQHLQSKNKLQCRKQNEGKVTVDQGGFIELVKITDCSNKMLYSEYIMQCYKTMTLYPGNNPVKIFCGSVRGGRITEIADIN